jgi:FAD/FMN-containing dehydrogenase
VNTAVIDRLNVAVPDGVIVPGHRDYDDARTTFNATIDRRPAMIVRCRTIDDVVAAVVAARDLDLPVAVRGGGHGVAGHAVADDALVVDLSGMRGVEVDPVARLVVAEGGAQWDDLDGAAWAHHLAVVGGTFGDTGVAGLTLGGGLGWLMGIHGLTCDNLVRAEVVTADGTRVVAGPDGDSDLLWALRGGGGNFGVVTRFEFRAIDPGPLLAGHFLYPAALGERALRLAVELAESAPDALALFVVAGRGPADGSSSDGVSVGVCWPGDPELGASVLRPLRELGPIEDDVVDRSYLDIQAMAGRIPFGLRHYWKGHFLRALEPATIDGILTAVTDRAGDHSIILMEAIRGAARAEPPGGAAFGQRAARWNASALAIWEDPVHDDAEIAWARATADGFAPASLTGAGYANYAPADETTERVKLAFGPERYARLASIKRRYDPDNRFRSNLNIRPA